MTATVFSTPRILLTAVACALVAGFVLRWRSRRATGQAVPALVLSSLLVGVLVFAWRELSNALRINDDFLPGVSLADIGGGVTACVALLALTPLQPAARPWLVTAALIAAAAFIVNVVLI